MTSEQTANYFETLSKIAVAAHLQHEPHHLVSKKDEGHAKNILDYYNGERIELAAVEFHLTPEEVLDDLYKFLVFQNSMNK